MESAMSGAAADRDLRPRRRTRVRELNQFLHRELPATRRTARRVLNPDGAHNIAVGVDAPVDIDVRGPRRLLRGRHEQAGDASPCTATSARASPRT